MLALRDGMNLQVLGPMPIAALPRSGAKIATLVSTWVGGGYINGTAEAVYDRARGLVWAQAPWCYGLSLVLGGLLFARRMRRYGFTTMLDLFARRYSKRIAAILYLPALLGESFWMAAILAALGTAFGTILGIDATTAVIISAVVAVLYTVVGGLWSRIHAFRPTWVGGCRPIELAPRLDPACWRPRHVSQLAPLGLAIEVVVAERLPLDS